ncbi:glycosyltransferase family 2 protein [Laspinema olomoucense]|uniref:Glycosyltransferase family 2 protein n=1 Tax=Laspinema olomoucense D3b TaxID=2953688 RepID=A0ABT2N9V4_9CYAN|nr:MULTISPECIES: glycosyltransferase family 2 protein [unclassified Laspinema]MCT7979483.1 glycosyltransferase family 2 protein [Laspinema sp. D3b]MCT7992147.1 glycosyltransferase family 2 protein [Laspinema sp. D3c]
MPKVSVCIPTYNRVELLPVAVESVLSQTYTDFELIVCDDGSTDETPKLMDKLSDRRVRYLRHPQNIGKSNNMRSGFEAATGDYFIKFDDDDRLTPEFLSQTIAILDQDSTLDFVGTDHWIIDIHNQRQETQTEQNSQRWGRGELSAGPVENLLEVVFVKQSFQIGATLFRRSALLDVGYMRPNLQNCEDNDLFVRLALSGKRGYYLPELLMEYRVHEGQQGLNRAIPYLGDKIQYLETYQFDSPELESIRQSRLRESQLLLGLRLVETGDTEKGRHLLRQGKSFAPAKAYLGLTLSALPLGLRGLAFKTLRQMK